MAEQQVGTVDHYFSHIGVAAIKLTGELSAGDTIHVVGHTTDFTQPVESIQIEHRSVEKAGPGEDIGIKVLEHVRQHDVVFKVTD